MKRGVVRLSPETSAILREMESDHFSPTLTQKIASLSPQVAFVELNREEVEQILDLLPPSDTAKSSQNQLRFELTNLLQA